MTLPSSPCFSVSRHVAVALAVSLDALFFAPTNADPFGDLTATPSGCAANTSCDGGSGSGGASLPGETGGASQCAPNGAGNPLNVLSGSKYQMEVELPPSPGVLGLEIVRHYNSQYARPNVDAGIFGRGWKLSYETEMHVVKNSVQIVALPSPAAEEASTPPSYKDVQEECSGDATAWNLAERVDWDEEGAGSALGVLVPGGGARVRGALRRAMDRRRA